MDLDGFEGDLPAGRRDAHELGSIVDETHPDAGNHLVSFGYLILDEKPDVGCAGQDLSNRLLVTVAAGLLVRNQSRVVDILGSDHLVQSVYVGLAAVHGVMRLVEAADQCLVLFH